MTDAAIHLVQQALIALVEWAIDLLAALVNGEADGSPLRCPWGYA